MECNNLITYYIIQISEIPESLLWVIFSWFLNIFPQKGKRHWKLGPKWNILVSNYYHNLISQLSMSTFSSNTFSSCKSAIVNWGIDFYLNQMYLIMCSLKESSKWIFKSFDTSTLWHYVDRNNIFWHWSLPLSVYI